MRASAERAGDRGRRHELGEVEHPQLFRRVADACGIVDDQRFALDALEQVRRGDVAEVERRVLAHQHDVDVAAEIEDSRLAEAIMVAVDALDGDRIAHRPQPPLGEAQVFGRVMEELVPELLRLEHDREGRIAGDIDPLERVHLHGDAEAHGAAALVSDRELLSPLPDIGEMLAASGRGTMNSASIRMSSPSRM